MLCIAQHLNYQYCLYTVYLLCYFNSSNLLNLGLSEGQLNIIFKTRLLFKYKLDRIWETLNVYKKPIAFAGMLALFLMVSKHYLVVNIVAADTVRVHEKGAALAGAGTALRDIRVVLGAPVVPELVRRHQVRLARNHSLSVVIATGAQS